MHDWGRPSLEFARDYAKAWCSGNADAVASFFAEDGSITINGGPPFIGPAAIAGMVRGFMSDFPDLRVTFDRLEDRADGTAFHWTLIGTNTGPGGLGKPVRISGYELWQLEDGKIKISQGHFDAADYDRQLGRNA